MNIKLPVNIDDLLHQRTVESERIEYKEGWNPESILHTICAFANDFYNLGGGYIIIGVAEDNGRPCLPPKGLESKEIDSIQKELLNLGRSAISPSYAPLSAVYKIQNRDILALWVPGGENRPYKAKTSLGKKPDWALYLRKHTSTVKATVDDEPELYSLTAKVPYDDRYQQLASLSDLSPYLIREYLNDIRSELASKATELDVEALGKRMNLIGGPPEHPFPKNVGLLFFNENPELFFPATQIDVVYFPNGPGGDFFEEKIFRGPLGRITRDALNSINRNYLKERVVKHPDKPEAERFWNFPFAAVEEAVVNAVYHRSYEIREPIEIRITNEELCVLSYPGPDRSIRLEDLRAGRAVSRRYRNRRIGEFLKELDLTEGRSTGIPKILRVMKNNGSPKPYFETDDERSSFLIRLPIHRSFLNEFEEIQSINQAGITTEQVAGATEQVESTTEQVEGTTEQVEGATEQVESTTEQVAGATEQVAGATEQVAGATEQVAGATEQVAGATEQVAGATEQVAGATEQVEGTTEQVAGAIEQVAGATEQVAGITEQVAKLLVSLQEKELGTKALLDILNLSHRPTFLHNYLQPALDAQLVEMTQPESPRSPTQKYRLTLKGAKYSKRLS